MFRILTMLFALLTTGCAQETRDIGVPWQFSSILRILDSPHSIYYRVQEWDGIKSISPILVVESSDISQDWIIHADYKEKVFYINAEERINFPEDCLIVYLSLEKKIRCLEIDENEKEILVKKMRSKEIITNEVYPIIQKHLMDRMAEQAAGGDGTR